MSDVKTEEMRVVEATPFDARKQALIIGVPDIGLVGPIAASHIVQSLGMAEIGYVESDILPPVVIVHKNHPRPPLRLYGSENLAVMTTEVALTPRSIFHLTRTLTRWAKMRNIEFVVGMTGLAVPNRMEVEKPTVYAVGSTDNAKALIQKAEIPTFDEGVLVGTYALLIRECLRENQPNITFLAESHFQFPDPGASASTIQSLNSLLNLNIGVQELLDKAEEIRVKARELMRRTQEQMKGMQKIQEQEVPGIYV